MRQADRQRLEEVLGYTFQNPQLLTRALTHASASTRSRPDNQRLEFLGDRVLGLVMAEALLMADRTAREGQIAPRFNALVRKETCAEIAGAIDLGQALVLGRSEALSGGRRKLALLGDAMEAVIAAIYRDGGLQAARDVILRLWGGRIDQAAPDARDPKTRLQEWAQARGWATPRYVDIGRSGPDHAPVFEVEARLENDMSARAKAPAKRAAQQDAAARLLTQLETLDD